MTLTEIVTDLHRLTSALSALRTAGGPESEAAGEAGHYVAIAGVALSRVAPPVLGLELEPAPPPPPTARARRGVE